MLITFEGIDGSGKSTQIALLKEKLIESGYKVEVFREPGGTEVSELIRKMLLNTQFEIDPVAEVLLFSAARSQLVAKKVKPLLENNVIVILDRFYDSTTAYQGYGRENLALKDIHHINRIATQSLIPDITFYLQVNLEEAAKRTQNTARDRMEQAGDAFFLRVQKGFEELAKQEERIKTIEADQSPENVHEQITNFLKSKLSLQ